MARTSDPHSANAQFFINTKDNRSLNPKSGRWGYAVFGSVIEGMDVVDRISKVITDREFMLKSMVLKIPEGAKQEDWIEIIDSVTRKRMYSKIPMGQTKSSYMDTVRKALRSNNPYRRVEIEMVRVVASE